MMPRTTDFLFATIAIQRRQLHMEQVYAGLRRVEVMEAQGEAPSLADVLLSAKGLTDQEREAIQMLREFFDINRFAKRFCRLAMRNNMISQDDFHAAIATQRQAFLKGEPIPKIGKVLVNMGLMKPNQVTALIAALDELEKYEHEKKSASEQHRVAPRMPSAERKSISAAGIEVELDERVVEGVTFTDEDLDDFDRDLLHADGMLLEDPEGLKTPVKQKAVAQEDDDDSDAELSVEADEGEEEPDDDEEDEGVKKEDDEDEDEDEDEEDDEEDDEEELGATVKLPKPDVDAFAQTVVDDGEEDEDEDDEDDDDGDEEKDEEEDEEEEDEDEEEEKPAKRASLRAKGRDRAAGKGKDRKDKKEKPAKEEKSGGFFSRFRRKAPAGPDAGKVVDACRDQVLEVFEERYEGGGEKLAKELLADIVSEVIDEYLEEEYPDLPGLVRKPLANAAGKKAVDAVWKEAKKLIAKIGDDDEEDDDDEVDDDDAKMEKSPSESDAGDDDQDDKAAADDEDHEDDEEPDEAEDEDEAEDKGDEEEPDAKKSEKKPGKGRLGSGRLGKGLKPRPSGKLAPKKGLGKKPDRAALSKKLGKKKK